MFSLLLVALSLGVDPGYEWRPWNDGSEEYALMLNGHQVGSYNAKKDVYRPKDRLTQEWGPKCTPPINPPFRNFGVITDAAAVGTHYRMNGVEISSKDADDFFADKLADSSAPQTGKKRVVIIGKEDDTLPVFLAFVKRLTEPNGAEDYIVQEFRPDDWQVKDSGFVTTGSPTIYFLDSTGKVLYRRDDFECGAEGLFAALRDADPDYKPESDPGPANPLADSNSPVTMFGLGACLLFVVALALFIYGVKKWRISPSS